MQSATGLGAPEPPPQASTTQEPHQSGGNRHQAQGGGTDKVLLRLSCKDNKIAFTIEDIVLSCRALAQSCGHASSDVYMASAQKNTGPYTVAVSKKVAPDFLVDTINIFGAKTDEEADFEVIELDEDGFTQASRTRFAMANAERAARRTARSDSDLKTIRLFVDMPDTYMIKPLGAFNELVDKTMATYASRLRAIASPDEVRINVISVESSTLTALPYNTFLIFAEFANKSIAQLALLDFTPLKYCDDEVSSQMARARMPKSNLEALKFSGCCFRPEGVCEAERAANGNHCLVRDNAYEARRQARRSQGPSEEFREARAQAKAEAKAMRKRMREEAQAELDAKNKAHRDSGMCKRWLAGKCLRVNGNCSTRHTRDAANKDDADIRATDTACIDCASLEGGVNYDPKWVCKQGNDCPYSHVLARTS